MTAKLSKFLELRMKYIHFFVFLVLRQEVFLWNFRTIRQKFSENGLFSLLSRSNHHVLNLKSKKSSKTRLEKREITKEYEARGKF